MPVAARSVGGGFDIWYLEIMELKIRFTSSGMPGDGYNVTYGCALLWPQKYAPQILEHPIINNLAGSPPSVTLCSPLQPSTLCNPYNAQKGHILSRWRQVPFPWVIYPSARKWLYTAI